MRGQHARIRARDRVDGNDLLRRAQIQQLQKHILAHAGVGRDDLRALDKFLLCLQVSLRHVLLDDGHVGHADQHIAVSIQNGQVNGRTDARDAVQMGNIDARVLTGLADEAAERIVAHAGQKLHVRAQPREIFAHVACHAARGQADVAGIGVPQADGRL